MKVRSLLAAVAIASVAMLGTASAAEAGASRAVTSEQQAAGQLDYALDGWSCRSAGGKFGHGVMGARGYLDEIGATGVTRLRVTITAQKKFASAPIWRNVTSSFAAYSVSFASAPDAASHRLLGPSRPLLWSWSFRANDDANNVLYRMSLKFVWSGPSVSVTHTLDTEPCFSN